MNFWKAALVIHVGIYLVLPSCLCQFAHAFGLEHPHHEYVQVDSEFADDRESAGVVVFPGREIPSDCHADDHLTKVADIGRESSGVPVGTPGSFARNESGVIAHPPLREVSILRVPPPRVFHRWTSREFTCLYLV